MDGCLLFTSLNSQVVIRSSVDYSSPPEELYLLLPAGGSVYFCVQCEKPTTLSDHSLGNVPKQRNPLVTSFLSEEEMDDSVGFADANA